MEDDIAVYKRHLGAIKSKMHELVYKMSFKLGNHQMIRIKEAEALLLMSKDWQATMNMLNKCKKHND